MLSLPALVQDFDFAYQTLQIVASRYRQPSWSIPGKQFVPVTPVGMRILNVVIEDEEIDVVNEIEVASPGYIVGLKDSNFVVLGLHDMALLEQ